MKQSGGLTDQSEQRRTHIEGGCLLAHISKIDYWQVFCADFKPENSGTHPSLAQKFILDRDGPIHPATAIDVSSCFVKVTIMTF